MAQTSVPPFQITATGPVAPAEQDIFNGVMADMNAAFGGNMNTDPTTPQGQLGTSHAAIIGDANDALLQIVNGVDPAFSSGRMQDAIGRLYFMTRIAAVPTSVTCTCIGLAGTVIPAGALALAVDGNQYSCTSGGTIPSGGSISLQFQCVTKGPISCPAGTLNTIYQSITGWDSITNPADGIIGSNVETRAAFEARRQASVASNSRGFNDAMKGALLAIPNVIDAYVFDNDTGATETVNGVTLNASELFVAVEGGDDTAVATSIWSKKSPGAPYYAGANTTVTITAQGYNPPAPTYTVKFVRPTAVPIYFAVTLKNSPQVPANAAALIQAAIISAFSGGDGGPSATIGSTVFASRFYADVAALGSWVNLISIVVGTTSSPSANSVTVHMDQIPAIATGQITVSLV
jgi:uncharacterized phage protein gp47/JayE